MLLHNYFKAKGQHRTITVPGKPQGTVYSFASEGPFAVHAFDNIVFNTSASELAVGRGVILVPPKSIMRVNSSHITTNVGT